MEVEYRKDANLVLGYILVCLNELCNSKLEKGEDLVQTIGMITSRMDCNEKHPELHLNAVPIVSGFAYFSLDVRSVSNSLIESYCNEAIQVVKAIAEEFGVRAGVSIIGGGPALESLDEDIQSVLEVSADAQRIFCVRMASGATHDASIVGQQKRSNGKPIPVGMLFIPCCGGKSHCPEEFTSTEAIAKGASVLAESLYQLSIRD
jgi:acetylornithine deacetylase/succinyl-diaminopimelate desuccinylase-like protein